PTDFLPYSYSTHEREVVYGIKGRQKGDGNLKLRKQGRRQATGMMNLPLASSPLCVRLISHSQVPDTIFSREAAKRFHPQRHSAKYFLLLLLLPRNTAKVRRQTAEVQISLRPL